MRVPGTRAGLFRATGCAVEAAGEAVALAAGPALAVGSALAMVLGEMVGLALAAWLPAGGTGAGGAASVQPAANSQPVNAAMRAEARKMKGERT